MQILVFWEYFLVHASDIVWIRLQVAKLDEFELGINYNSDVDESFTVLSSTDVVENNKQLIDASGNANDSNLSSTCTAALDEIPPAIEVNSKMEESLVFTTSEIPDAEKIHGEISVASDVIDFKSDITEVVDDRVVQLNSKRGGKKLCITKHNYQVYVPTLEAKLSELGGDDDSTNEFQVKEGAFEEANFAEQLGTFSNQTFSENCEHGASQVNAKLSKEGLTRGSYSNSNLMAGDALQDPVFVKHSRSSLLSETGDVVEIQHSNMSKQKGL
ncbi:hypothetical protein FRX31_022602 [Thalictrum thalictroides]|uniref:Uncharacterized protein n=1 Tax=Thalictrum thalictroides TaxID=46969 RepID=A0A7J6VSS6_THATH|nr:hypothetical protein FRX31_022602 [Thalictrum thalictroides]